MIQKQVSQNFAVIKMYAVREFYFHHGHKH